jgi:hypothetical protein
MNQENKRQIKLVSIEEIKPIKLFDILIDDIHSMSDKDSAHTIDGTAGLTYHEVLEWISSGGDWYFKVTEHNNPENVFMTGSTYEDMNAARKGESHYHVAEVSEGELSDVRKIFNRKRRKEYGME